MKKALVLALTAFMVLSLATAAFAVEVSYEGKVQVKWANNPDKAVEDYSTSFDKGDLEAKIFLDFTEEYDDNISAGLKVKAELTDPYDDVGFTLEDTKGWIKFDYDVLAATASTHIGGEAGKDFGQCGIGDAAGVEVVAKLVDGFTATGIVNKGGADGYGLVLKGAYEADLFTLGGGFQLWDGRPDIKDAKADNAFGVYGTFNIIDNLTAKAEFGSRTLNDEANGWDADAITGILAGAKYDDSVLMIDANFLKLDRGFDIINFADDADKWLLRDYVKNQNTEEADDPFEPALAEPFGEASVIYVDASYAITDSLKVLGSFDYLLSVKDEDGKDAMDDIKDIKMNLSYKVGLESQLTEKLKAEGWYRAFGKTTDKNDDNKEVDATQFGAKATYTFVENVEGSFEVTYGTSMEDALVGLRYTAMVSASF